MGIGRMLWLGLVSLVVAAWIGAAFLWRAATFAELASLVWLDAAVGDWPLVGGLVAALMGAPAALSDLYGIAASLGVLAAHTFAATMLFALLEQWRRQSERAVVLRTGVVLGLAVALSLAMGWVDWWSSVAHGAWRFTLEEALAHGFDTEDMTLIDLPPLEVFLHPDEWALLNEDGEEMELALGSASMVLKVGAWGRVLGLGVVPGLVLASLGRRVWRTLPR